MPDFAKASLAWTLTWDADWMTAVTFVGASRSVVAGNNGGGLMLWELPEKPGGDVPKPKLILDGHTNCVSRLASSPDGKAVYSASYDHAVKVWDVAAKPTGERKLVLNARAIESAEARKRNGAKVPPALPATVGVIGPAKTLTGHDEWVVGLDLTRDGEGLLTGDDGGKVIRWDTATGKPAKAWNCTGWAYGVALSPDQTEACVGERLPVVFDSARHAGLKLWDAKTGEMKKNLSADFKGQYIAACAYSLDGKVLAVGRGGEADGNNGVVTLLEPGTGKKLRALAPGHLSGLTDIAFHPDGKHVASCGRDTVVRVWEIKTGKLAGEIGKGRGGQFKDWIHAIAFSADGRWLLAADMIGAVQVWHLPG